MTAPKKFSSTKYRHRQLVVGESTTHVVEGGQADKPAIVFLHGWPEDWSAFERVMALASKDYRVVALDLPGVGLSTTPLASGSKRLIARHLHTVLQALKLREVTLVGHDVGGQIAYAYLRQYHEALKSAVIMDVAIPGLEPWDEVLHNPHIWHFAFHNVPVLPEKLVHGKQGEYFDFFFNAIAARPRAISKATRQRYAKAYGKLSGLRTGFNWYRAFTEDAQANAADTGLIDTPVLYMRGDREGGDLSQYVRGFNHAGLRNVTHAAIANCGHFAPEEQPVEVWRQIARFIQTL